MFEITLTALAPLALILLGLMLLWLASRRADHVSPWNGVVVILLRVAGIVLLLIPLLFVLAVMTHVFAVVLWIATIVVLMSTVGRYFAAEQQSLLWMLAVAAEHDIPLASAARSFADERNDRVGHRAGRLAFYLESGVPLSLALRRSKTSVPSAVMLAADLGEQSGNLGSELRKAVDQVNASDATLRWSLERLFYVGFVISFSSGAVAFLMWKIFPVLAKMFDEFDLRLPPLTIAMIEISDAMTNGWPLFIPLLLIWVLFLVIGLCWYMGVPPHWLPLIHRLWWTADCAIVLRWLATSVRQQRPLAEVIRTLAIRFPQHRIRMRLEFASNRIDCGANWCDSMQAAGLIRQSESALFKTAERVGNLDWTLDEMANSGTRRAAYRIRAWMNIAFPVIVLILGVLVLFISAAFLSPLVSLILVLS
jgi:type II secretory pathway component PulF